MITCMLITFLRGPLEGFVAAFARKVIPVGKFPIGSKLREQKIEEFAERPYKIITHTFFSIAMYNILKDGNFLHTQLWGGSSDP